MILERRRYKVFAGLHKSPTELDLYGHSVEEVFWKAVGILQTEEMDSDIIWIKDDSGQVVWHEDRDEQP